MTGDGEHARLWNGGFGTHADGWDGVRIIEVVLTSHWSRKQVRSCTLRSHPRIFIKSKIKKETATKDLEYVSTHYSQPPIADAAGEGRMTLFL